jgi:hypothetical protein
MKFTRYFESVVPLKHPGIELQWIQRVLDNPIKRQIQDDGRISFWGNIAEMDGRALRVVTLEDGDTVHNAFFDRNFYRRQLRGDEPI